jgi:hypothetical protein
MAYRELRRSVLPLVLLATAVLAATRYAHGSAPPLSSSSEGQQIGKILSVRKVLRNHYFVSRYPQIQLPLHPSHRLCTRPQNGGPNRETNEARGGGSCTGPVEVKRGPL